MSCSLAHHATEGLFNAVEWEEESRFRQRAEGGGRGFPRFSGLRSAPPVPRRTLSHGAASDREEPDHNHREAAGRERARKVDVLLPCLGCRERVSARRECISGGGIGGEGIRCNAGLEDS